MTDLYETVDVAGRWTIGAPLRGGPDRGMFRGVGECPVLVTVGAPQGGTLANVERALTFPIDGIAPLLAITEFTIESVPYHALVEREPAGNPIADARPSDPRQVARDLIEIIARAHRAAFALGGIRPELVYADGNRCSGIAPRAEPFLAGARERSYGVPPCFDEIYASPESLMLKPATPASDVYSLCATLAFLFTGKHPAAGETVLERVEAVLRGDLVTDGAPMIVREGLATDPNRRPTIDKLAAALA